MINYISIQEVMDDLLDNPLLENVSLERVVNYTVQFIKKIGAAKLFSEKNTELEIKDYRALLPCDFIDIIGVMTEDDKSFRSATDTFFYSRCNDTSGDLTYKLQNSVIYTNIERGKIIIAYKALELDENGFPYIPDNGSFKDALELYIERMVYRGLFAQGKINQAVYADTKRDAVFAQAQAEEDLVRMSMDEAESFTNMWNQLLTKSNEHNHQYRFTGVKEYIKTH